MHSDRPRAMRARLSRAAGTHGKVPCSGPRGRGIVCASALVLPKFSVVTSAVTPLREPASDPPEQRDHSDDEQQDDDKQQDRAEEQCEVGLHD